MLIRSGYFRAHPTGTIRLWSLDAWQQVVVYKGHVGPVWSISWGPYGHYFVSGGMDKTARIWMTHKVGHVRMLTGHDNDVEVVAWHPNNGYVFTGSCDRTVRMWAMNNGTPVRMFTGHTSPITALACSRNGKLLASADDSGSILLWDLGPGRLLKTHAWPWQRWDSGHFRGVLSLQCLCLPVPTAQSECGT